ncbi:hypothetical protein GCM10027160_07960 [Streptomyces calidiresistens]
MVEDREAVLDGVGGVPGGHGRSVSPGPVAFDVSRVPLALRAGPRFDRDAVGTLRRDEEAIPRRAAGECDAEQHAAESDSHHAGTGGPWTPPDPPAVPYRGPLPDPTSPLVPPGVCVAVHPFGISRAVGDVSPSGAHAPGAWRAGPTGGFRSSRFGRIGGGRERGWRDARGPPGSAHFRVMPSPAVSSPGLTCVPSGKRPITPAPGITFGSFPATHSA